MATSPVSIIVRWERVPCINRNSNITGYIVRYSTGGSSTVNVSVFGTDQSDRICTVTLLAPSTSYSIQVAAVTSSGTTGPFSATITEEMLLTTSEIPNCSKVATVRSKMLQQAACSSSWRLVALLLMD